MSNQHHDQGDGRLCVIDQRRYPTRGQVCDACRSWLHGKLNVIPRLYADMLALYAQLHADERARDPLNRLMPAGPKPGLSNNPRVTSSGEGRIPIGITYVDLSMAARTAEARYQHRGNPADYPINTWIDDQTGHISVATELDLIVRDWRDTIWPTSILPDADVDSLSRWLRDRLDDACDRHPAINDHAEAIRSQASRLHAINGYKEVDDYKHGVPCRGCDMLTLYQRNGTAMVECASCPELLSIEEYERWTALVAEAQRIDRGYKSVEAALQAITKKRDTPNATGLKDDHRTLNIRAQQ